ncbi:pilin outer membrane usher protein SafC [Serratia marcescens]|nr:pilin outer membrane usher protein SafC [Serratia marcescens]MBH3003367.1 fimbria/pilus outer membrane usher protein [Serratia marcescens]MBH3198310.1 fimbria/pilus outer membrane usher protein [Serratia marcescens]MBH3336778.1 fimbria/pilus outer membrane usher protein [Serratia marcescens]HEJ6928867.1 fimbria/pilus outer membrane usher protein [Serratia marcescens]
MYRTACTGGLIVTLLSSANARTWSFDASQLGRTGQGIDISVFNQGGQLPGSYFVDVMLNGELIDAREMTFHQEKDAKGQLVLKTCLTRTQLVSYGIRVDKYPTLFPAGDGAKCASLQVIPHATQELQFSRQRLVLSVPQVALVPVIKGIAPQALWDEGVPALLMNYQTSASWSASRKPGVSASEAYFARFDPGLNLGAWRLRNMTTWRQVTRQRGKWQTADTWAERGLNTLKSRLTLGDRYTPSDVFGSVPFRGGMLGSDELMVPANQRESVPVIRGIARTQARVDVRQGGYVIYSTTVAPGPFALTDFSAGSNGDLEVTVAETDGAPQVFTIPWTAPAIAMREGYLKYNVMAGQYRPDDRGIRRASVVQGTIMYGLPRGLSAYGGLQWAEQYHATSLGLGMQLGYLGALSVDGIWGKGKLPTGDTTQGQTWRLRYNKVLDTTGTGISLSSSRYSSAGDVSLGAVLNRWRSGTWGCQDALRLRRWDDRQREARYTMTLSQSLGKWGAVNLMGTRETYRSGDTRSELTASLSSVTRGIGWSLNWTQRHSPQYGEIKGRHYRSDQEISLWLNIPLERKQGRSMYATYQMQSGNDGRVRHDAGLNGTDFNQQLHWSVRQQFQPGAADDNRYGGLMNLTWAGSSGVIDGGYSYSGATRQLNAGMSGGVVIHEHGITLGQPMSGAMALVSAPGVSGVSVNGAPGIKTDFRGYTVQSGLGAYQENLVELNPTTLPINAELPLTGRKVVPTDGAILPVKFATRVGARAVIALRQTGGQVVPFGAVVTVVGDDRQGSGIVGGDVEVYMSGLPKKGELSVHWGNGRRCRVNYRLPEEAGPAGVFIFRRECH